MNPKRLYQCFYCILYMTAVGFFCFGLIAVLCSTNYYSFRGVVQVDTPKIIFENNQQCILQQFKSEKDDYFSCKFCPISTAPRTNATIPEIYFNGNECLWQEADLLQQKRWFLVGFLILFLYIAGALILLLGSHCLFRVSETN